MKIVFSSTLKFLAPFEDALLDETLTGEQLTKIYDGMRLSVFQPALNEDVKRIEADITALFNAAKDESLEIQLKAAELAEVLYQEKHLGEVKLKNHFALLQAQIKARATVLKAVDKDIYNPYTYNIMSIKSAMRQEQMFKEMQERLAREKAEREARWKAEDEARAKARAEEYARQEEARRKQQEEDASRRQEQRDRQNNNNNSGGSASNAYLSERDMAIITFNKYLGLIGKPILHTAASKEEIKAAFRILFRAYHPDTVGDTKANNEVMAIINDAYDTLK